MQCLAETLDSHQPFVGDHFNVVVLVLVIAPILSFGI